MRALSKELRKIRNFRGLTLRAVESKTGISNAYLSQLERGIATRPSPSVLARIAEFYEISYEDLMKLAGYLNVSQPGKISEINSEIVSSSDTKQDKEWLRQLETLLPSLDEEDGKLLTDYVSFLKARKSAS